MKKIIFLMVFLVCMNIACADSDFRISNPYGDYGLLGMNLESRQDDVSNARVRAVILDQGIYFPAQTVDISEDNPYRLMMMSEEPVPEGEYLVRISIRKGSERKVVYRYVLFE
jgi:hypothetical protein